LTSLSRRNTQALWNRLRTSMSMSDPVHRVHWQSEVETTQAADITPLRNWHSLVFHLLGVLNFFFNRKKFSKWLWFCVVVYVCLNSFSL
jgi:hypothetical protein